MCLHMRYVIVMLICLLPVSCAKTSVQATDDLWEQWRAIDVLEQADYPDVPPIILVHGWNGSEFTWSDVENLRRFEAHMHRDIYFFTYRTGLVPGRFPPIELLEEKFERYLLPFKQVDVIAHSMGGLIVRQYLTHHSEHPIRRLVFLSTPHFGTNAAALLESIASVSPEGNLQADEMRPGSDFLWQLNLQEGRELQGIEVLNAYVDGDSVLSSDLVVSSYSAWLPWAVNVSIPKGDHHTLASGLMKYDFLLRFLSFGALPDLATMPKQRSLWLRVRDENGEGVALTVNSLRRLNAKLEPNKRGISRCCKRPSALYESMKQSLLIENIQPEDVLWLMLRDGYKPLELKKAGVMDAYKQPIILQEILLHAAE
ncbi:MAG: hypothetical protein COC22_04035 [Flavobacteriaceae bacterium]|nr:MAG: hypothetical protein COC22_04035 [Flavobacteriaceae bacterium]